MKGYPQWFSKNLIHSVLFITFVSGLILLPTTLEMKLAWTVPWRATEGYRISTTAIHLLAGFFVCSILGALSTLHMRSGWIRKEKRWSGAMLTSLCILLILSSIGILYSGNESVSFVSSLTHSTIGIIISVIYLIHTLIIKSARKIQYRSRNRVPTQTARKSNR